ncbi:MAG TPA: protein kinase, partial [Gemmataceae bacterium]|nr:protein kinase [Gemmataceae bacterium]
MTATHPTDRELQSFLLGKLADPDQGQVESHLADCPECGRRALSTPADDTLTELLAAARTRLDSERASAPTPTLDGSATPPAFAPTLAWEAPGADATGLAPPHPAAPPALATHPKYRVVRRLGTGGMGTVWLAEHQVMHRPVAVKVIRPDLLARPGATDRFLREVRAAARLHHPNIVTAFDAEPVGDSCLLVMEYVPGQTLGERLEAGPLPVAEACRAVRDAARGLAQAHAVGLVHRDVKPHNLIRAADGTTKVLDFGLAGVGAGEVPTASGDGLTGAGMVVGTPDYIAPEQIADPHAADARADIYGLGCTLYHLLAGRPPLPDGSVAEKLAAQPTYKPDPIPGLAADLTAVLAKMLAKRPEDRYQTADEVVDALDRIIDGVRPTPAHKWSCTGKPWPLSAVLAVAAIVVAAGVVFKIHRDNQIVQVEVDDPDIEVVMKRKGEIVLIRDAKTGRTWEYDTFKHQIGLVDEPDGLKLGVPEGQPFVLRRNGERAFTVTRLAAWSTWNEPARQAQIEAATQAAEAWLKLFDASEYVRAREEAGAIIHRALPKDEMIRRFQAAAQTTGKLRARSAVRRQYGTAFLGLPEGEYVGIWYRADYELLNGLTELMVLAREPDGHWRVASYGVVSGPGSLGTPGATAPTPDRDGWTALFNGKDLTGWVQMYDTAKHRSPPWDVVGEVLQL